MSKNQSLYLAFFRDQVYCGEWLVGVLFVVPLAQQGTCSLQSAPITAHTLTVNDFVLLNLRGGSW